MTRLRVVALAALSAALALVTGPQPLGAQTGPRSQDTYFTFSQPVELPNATLPAGSYLFQLVDSTSNRHVVRVMSRDRQKLFTTVMAIPSYSLDRVPDEPQVRFMEMPAGAPNVVKLWLYPGTSTGHEFVYPRNRAAQLARSTGEPVLTTKSESDVSRSVAESDLTRIDREGRDVDAAMSAQRESAGARTQSGTMQPDATTAGTQASSAATTSTPATAGATATGTTATAGTTGTAGTGATARTPGTADRDAAAPRATAGAGTGRGTRTALPSTAGSLPLLSLLGVAALAGSALTHRARRR
jgi:hypothetical protein